RLRRYRGRAAVAGGRARAGGPGVRAVDPGRRLAAGRRADRRVRVAYGPVHDDKVAARAAAIPAVRPVDPVDRVRDRRRSVVELTRAGRGGEPHQPENRYRRWKHPPNAPQPRSPLRDHVHFLRRVVVYKPASASGNNESRVSERLVVGGRSRAEPFPGEPPRLRPAQPAAPPPPPPLTRAPHPNPHPP